VLKRRKRRLQTNSVRAGVGPYSREIFLQRLNESALLRPSDNLLRILELICEMNEIALADPTADATPSPAPEKSIRTDMGEFIIFNAPTRVHELEHELCLRTKRYTSHPSFWFRKGKLLSGWSHLLGPGIATADIRLVPNLLDALMARDLQKLARCQNSKCNGWYFRRRIDQRFCKGRCRDQAFSSTHKEEKKLYMREYRRTVILLDSGGTVKAKSAKKRSK